MQKKLFYTEIVKLIYHIFSLISCMKKDYKIKFSHQNINVANNYVCSLFYNIQFSTTMYFDILSEIDSIICS